MARPDKPIPRPMEHRWGERIDLALPVDIVRDGTTTPGRLVSASVSGALLECEAKPPQFTSLRVILPATPDRERDPVDLAACVVRHTDRGLAVEWRDMASPHIVALLARISGHDLDTLCRDPAFPGRCT
jgi:hypothetical protein